MKKSSILRVDNDEIGEAALLALAGFCISGIIIAMIGGDVYYAEGPQSYRVAGTKEDAWFVAGTSVLLLALRLLSAVLHRARLRKEALHLWGSGEKSQAIHLWRKLEGD